METFLLTDEIEDLNIAAIELKHGKTVVFPTETVYGLGANGLCEEAVKKIFQAKGRPSDNPLILHVADLTWVPKLATDIPQSFYRLANNFWPGPLTMVLKASFAVPSATTGGLNTVALRIPGHPVALELLKLVGAPIAAPSANTSGRPSPTSHNHVIEDLYGRVDYIVKGGQTALGIESTVVDLTSPIPKILRPGSITQEELEEIIEIGKFKEDSVGPILSPGVKYRHYQPKAPMKILLGEDEKVIDEINRRTPNLVRKYEKIGVLCYSEDLEHLNKEGLEVLPMGSKNNLKEVANNLYRTLRDFDHLNVNYIVGRGITKPQGLGIAISNRLNKACGNNIEVV